MNAATALSDLAQQDLSGFVRVEKGGRARLELLVKGARCANCMAKIERGVMAVPGVDAARLNLTTGRLQVSWPQGKVDPAEVVRTLDGLGYPSAPFDPLEAETQIDKEGRRLALALGVAGFGVGNVMMFSVPAWGALFGQEMGDGSRTAMYWLSALIAAPCTIFSGRVFFESAFRSLRRGKANMDVPISLGLTLTLLISFSETIMGGKHAYFDAAISLVFLLLIGRYFDHQLRHRARGAARALMLLQAPTAQLLDEAGVARGVPVREVKAGDLLAVAPGERVPVDAVVETGLSELDLALVTGESLPVHAGPGVRAPAGALNMGGRLVLRATSAAEDSTLAETARLMEAGAQSKSKYVRLADKAANIYVPVVHSLAALGFVGALVMGLGVREALLRAVAVLIVTCPCALGLAVPAVQIAASGRLFRKGVLVKSGAALERLAEIDTVVFDKTGVLTVGRAQLVEFDAAALPLAAELARASRHPLSRALADAAGAGPAATDAREIAGQGVEGTVGGLPARLGRAHWVGVDHATATETELWFRIEGGVAHRFAFADNLRHDAISTVAACRKLGLQVHILSGDVTASVQRMADAVQVADWRAGLTPADKAAAIDALQAAGRKVLMVGDGLNDAAALARAHASMAPGLAADVSQTASDLVFTSERLDSVVEAVKVARKAKALALENFAFSAVYNAIAAPAALLGLVSPFVAAIAMSASSLVVSLNALRLYRIGRS
jgi:Cu2+-exporting ATPase